MTNRTTKRELEGLVLRLNRTTGNPLAPYTKHADGSHTPNAHNYHLDWAYGGVKLVQMCETGTGYRNVTLGYETKTGCYKQIAAYLSGIEDCLRQQDEHDNMVNKIVNERSA